MKVKPLDFINTHIKFKIEKINGKYCIINIL